MQMDEYRVNLQKAYDPATSPEEQRALLNKFLKFKSETINHGCPQNVLDAISHLKEQISANNSSNDSANQPPNTIFGKFIYYLNRPMSIQIVGGFVAGVAVLVFAAVIYHYYPSFPR